MVYAADLVDLENILKLIHETSRFFFFKVLDSKGVYIFVIALASRFRNQR